LKTVWRLGSSERAIGVAVSGEEGVAAAEAEEAGAEDLSLALEDAAVDSIGTVASVAEFEVAAGEADGETSGWAALAICFWSNDDCPAEFCAATAAAAG
jgi:hypothetical protein